MNRNPDVVFQTRSFGADPARVGVDLRVNNMEWDASGGPKDASITATGGSESALWELLEYLRRPVTIQHPHTGEPVWWGYVNAVTVRAGALEVGASLDSMINRVAVVYSYVAPGTNVVGSRATTTWVQDDRSVAAFGAKEFLSSCGGMTPEAAEARRGAILEAQKWPQAPAQQISTMNPRGRVRYSGAKKSRSATLALKGWWSTLGWKYVSVPTITAVSYEETTGGEQAVGAAEANRQVMQQVKIGDQSVNAVTVQVHVKKVGNPSDSLRVRIFTVIEADNDKTKLGLPDSQVESALIAPLDISTTAGWTLGNLSSEAALAAGKTYAMVVDRTGAVDATNYYVVTVSTALGYGDGFFRIDNAGVWAARSPDADMPFRIGVTNMVETTQQIADLIRQAGQFIPGTIIENPSGVKLASYLRGDTTADTEIDELLSAGGPNKRKMMASVMSDRSVRLWEQAASTTIAALLDGAGALWKMDQPVDEYLPPVGQWIRLKDVIPGSTDISKLIDPRVQFVEGAAWSKGQGTKLRFAGQPSIEDILAVRR